MKSSRICFLITTFLIASNILHTTSVSAGSPLNGISVTVDAEGMLKQFLPRISYTGLAITAGAAGICTSYYGVKHLCEPIENRKHAGKTELTIGLSTTAASIAIIHFLWNR